jgi:hypothetical protein
MKTILEQEAEIIRLGDVIELKKLLPVLSDEQLVRVCKRLLSTSQTTLKQIALKELEKRFGS